MSELSRAERIAEIRKSAKYAGNEYIDFLLAELDASEQREELWKDQAGRDQSENRGLKAQLAGKHCNGPSRESENVDLYFSVPQLIQFLREVARNTNQANPGGSVVGKWRSKEFEQAADRMEEMWESYLAVCDHEIAHEQAEAKLQRIRDKAASLRLAKPELPGSSPLFHAEFDWVRTLMADELESILDGKGDAS